MTTTDWSMKLELYSNAKEELDNTWKNFEDAKADLEKEKWLVQVGTTLSDDEKSGFVESVKSYVQSAIDTVEDASYMAHVSINAVLIPGTEANTAVSQYSQRFYSESQAELEKLGKELAQVVDGALGDGILTDEELININDIQSRMQVIMDKISEREYKVSLQKIAMNADKSGLTAESFAALINSASEKLQEQLDSSQGIEAEAMVSLSEMDISDAERDKWIGELQQNMLGNKVELTIPTVDLAVGTFTSNYSSEIETVKKNCQFNIDQAFKTLTIEDNWEQGLSDALVTGFSSVASMNSGELQKLIELMSPQKEQLEAMREKYVDMGKLPPSSLTQGLNDIYALEQMTGAADHTLALLANTISESPEQQAAITASIQAGGSITQSLADELRNNYGLVMDATTGLWTTVNTASATSQADAIAMMNEQGIQVGTALADSLASQYNLTYNSATKMWEAVNAATNGTDVESAVKTKADTIPQNVSDTIDSGTEEISESTSGAMNAVIDTMDSAMPDVEKTATDVGTMVDTATAEAIDNNKYLVERSAKEVAKSAAEEMQLTLNGITLDPPGMSTPDWTAEAESGLKGMQEYLNKKSLTVTVDQVVGTTVGHAAGGIFNVPHVAIVAEEAPGEAIIPLAASRRADAIGIWMETGRRLGMEAYESMVSAGHSLGSARSRAQDVRQKSSPSPSIVFEKDAVVIHTQAQDADEIYRTFKRRLDYDVSKEVRSRGSLT